MMNMKARPSVLIHHSAFRIHHFLSCPSCPSLLISPPSALGVRGVAAEDSFGGLRRLALEEAAEVVEVETEFVGVEAAVEVYVAPRAALGRERQAQRPEAARRVNLRRRDVAALPRPTHHAVMSRDFARPDFACYDIVRLNFARRDSDSDFARADFTRSDFDSARTDFDFTRSDFDFTRSDFAGPRAVVIACERVAGRCVEVSVAVFVAAAVAAYEDARVYELAEFEQFDERAEHGLGRPGLRHSARGPAHAHVVGPAQSALAEVAPHARLEFVNLVVAQATDGERHGHGDDEEHEARHASGVAHEEERRHAEERARAVEDEGDAALRPAARQEHVVYVPAVALEQGTAADEASDEREARVNDGHAEGQKRYRDRDGGRSVLRAVR